LHNLAAIFHELQTGSAYSINVVEKEESKIMELDELPEEEEVRRDSDSAMEQSKPEGNREFYGMLFVQTYGRILKANWIWSLKLIEILSVKGVLNPSFWPFSFELNKNRFFKMNFDLGFRVLRPRKLKIFKIFFPLED